MKAEAFLLFNAKKKKKKKNNITFIKLSVMQWDSSLAPPQPPLIFLGVTVFFPQ